ncbi:MAG TPA: phosphoglucomutase/phosphomannomutase family protein [Nitrospirota bacterium]|nr:phosphoglucomutase/phosphomannomutase family protein [Nitrospirota bacterium]
MVIDKIKFGTSGWRGVIADDFTVARVRVVTQAIADHIASQTLKERGIIVGYDTRFMSERFAEEAVKVLCANGIHTYLSNRDAPTPAISFEIIRRKAAGGINFTASHNPPQYNGLKFSPAWGGPALPETTKDIELKANALLEKSCIAPLSLPEAINKGLAEEVDLRKNYLDDLRKKIDVESIRKAKLKVAVDLLYGTGRDYLDTALQDAGCTVAAIHSNRDTMFGGHSPEPSEENLSELSAMMKKGKFDIGLAVDGDADRFGIVDVDGAYINPNQVLALVLDFLVRTRGWKGGAARSIATSHLIDAVAKKHGIEVYETGVGFKFIGDLLVQGKIIFGGEESAGMTIKDHVPEKDGILASLLVTEIVALEKKTIKELLKRLYKETGTILNERINIHLTEQNRKAVGDRLNQPLSELGGLRVKGKKTTADGTKYMLEDDSWVLMRASGTEPVVRLYAESSSEEKMKNLIDAGKRFIVGQ